MCYVEPDFECVCVCVSVWLSLSNVMFFSVLKIFELCRRYCLQLQTMIFCTQYICSAFYFFLLLFRYVDASTVSIIMLTISHIIHFVSFCFVFLLTNHSITVITINFIMRFVVVFLWVQRHRFLHFTGFIAFYSLCSLSTYTNYNLVFRKEEINDEILEMKQHHKRKG